MKNPINMRRKMKEIYVFCTLQASHVFYAHYNESPRIHFAVEITEIQKSVWYKKGKCFIANYSC